MRALRLLLFALLTAAPATGGAHHRARPPNIVLILADDLGYGDLGCYGQERIRTPNLDRMAAQGMRFARFYAGSTVCAPSRTVLLTGRHTGHCSLRGNGRFDLPPADVTLAEALKPAGYATAVIGKWGLANRGGPGVPARQGFDHFFGFLDHGHAHNYYPSFVYRDEERLELRNEVPDARPDGSGVATVRKEYAHDLFTRDALAWVREQRNRPFFLYLCYTIPHANNEAGAAGMEVPDLGRYRRERWPEAQKAHAAMIHRLDRDIGRLMALLRRLRLDERTAVFFTSDNGPHREGGNDPDFNNSNGPLRGIKRDLYEGGIRVPLIARWPGRIPDDTVSLHVGHFMDFMPTLCEIAGVPAPPQIDGKSFLPELLGRPDLQPQHGHLYWEFYERGSAQAVRMGRWKAVSRPFWSRPELYDLESDPGESRDVAAQHPRIVERAMLLMRASHVPSPLFRAPAPGVAGAASSASTGWNPAPSATAPAGDGGASD